MPSPKRCLDEQRATQMAAFFLKANKGEIPDFIKLVKLLYISDRLSLAEQGYSLTGDAHYSLPYGPIVSQLKDLLTESEFFSGAGYWKKHIERRDPHSVHLLSDPGTGRLGEGDMKILKRVQEEYGTMDTWELVNLTHDKTRFPEYEDPGGGRQEITYEAILAAQGYSQDAAEHVAAENRNLDALRCLLNDQNR